MSNNMTHICKRVTAWTLYLTVCAWLSILTSLHGDSATPYYFMTRSVAQQALMCDLAGVAQIDDVTSSKVDITFKQIWYGSPASNTVSVRFNDIGNTNGLHQGITVIAFAATNQWLSAIMSTNTPKPIDIYSFSVATNTPSGSRLFTNEWFTISDTKSFYSENKDFSYLTSYASNLVHAAKIIKNEQSFYEILGSSFDSQIPMISYDVFDFVYWRKAMVPTNLYNKVSHLQE